MLKSIVSFRRCGAWVLALLCCLAPPLHAATTVFSTDFESGIPTAITAPASVLAGVQGWAGLGPTGRKFAGSFLRHTAVAIPPTTLTLRNLPAHQSIDIDFLLAFIDSWDGTELFMVRVDGALLFSHWFQLATGDGSSYVAPPGGLLSSGRQLGFSNGSYYSRDRAYDMGVDSVFHGIPHTADSVVVTWSLGAVAGPAASQWQGGDDESWAIDGITVRVNNASLAVGDPPRPALALAAFPNPSRGGQASLRFSLATSASAWLELLDVSGRQIFTRDVTSFGVGSHTLSLADGPRLAPGIYLVNMRQGGVQKSARMVVLGD